MNDDGDTTRTSAGSTDARSYTRELRAASDLAVLKQMQPRHVLACPEDHSPEALVAVLRIWVGKGDDENAWLLCQRLVVGIEPMVRSRLAGYPWFDRDTREDIVQDLAVRLYEEWMSLDAQHAFWEVRFWHCLRLRIVDALRKRKPQETAVDINASGTADPVSEAVSPEEWAVAMLSMQRLPEHIRRAFVMKYYEGWTEEQIAARIGVTSRTIRNWIRRGHQIMREPADEVSQ